MTFQECSTPSTRGPATTEEVALNASLPVIPADELERRRGLVAAGREHEISFLNTDHVKAFELTDDFVEQAREVLKDVKVVPEFWREKYYRERAKNWEVFYRHTTDRFWHDRSWLLREFPPMSPFFEYDAKAYNDRPPGLLPHHKWRPNDHRILIEVGCGTGSTIFPAIARNPSLLAFGYDISGRAINSLKERWDAVMEGPPASPQKDETQHESPLGYVEDQWIGGQLIGGDVWDITEDLNPDEVLLEARKSINFAGSPASENTGQTGIADLVSLIFCLSAVPPAEQQAAAKRVAELLIPGGHLCFRDYGRYDELQLKFARSRIAKQTEKNCFVRGDCTLQYYWTLEEVDRLFVEVAGLEKVESKYLLREFKNRRTEQFLKRVWVQGLYRRPID